MGKEKVTALVTCDNCGKMFWEESYSDPGLDAHGAHGIALCSKCCLSDVEERYADLDLKAHWEPLTDEEMAEVELLQAELGLKPCTVCEGVGVIDLPSLAVNGWTEDARCKHCHGLGETGHSEALKTVMLGGDQ